MMAGKGNKVFGKWGKREREKMGIVDWGKSTGTRSAERGFNGERKGAFWRGDIGNGG